MQRCLLLLAGLSGIGAVAAESPSSAPLKGYWSGYIRAAVDKTDHYVMFSLPNSQVVLDQYYCTATLVPKSADGDKFTFDENAKFVQTSKAFLDRMTSPALECKSREITLRREGDHLKFHSNDGGGLDGTLYNMDCAATPAGPCEGFNYNNPVTAMGGLVWQIEKPDYGDAVVRTVSLVSFPPRPAAGPVHFVYVSVVHQGDFYYLAKAETGAKEKLTLFPISRVLADAKNSPLLCDGAASRHCGDRVESYKVTLDDATVRAAGTTGLAVHLSSASGIKLETWLKPDQIAAHLAALDNPRLRMAMPMIVPGRLIQGSCPDPVFPPQAKEKGEQGTVILKVMVGPDGRATEREIVKSSGFEDLDLAAAAAFLPCAFRPETLNGEPRKGWVEVKYSWPGP